MRLLKIAVVYISSITLVLGCSGADTSPESGMADSGDNSSKSDANRMNEGDDRIACVNCGLGYVVQHYSMNDPSVFTWFAGTLRNHTKLTLRVDSVEVLGTSGFENLGAFVNSPLNPSRNGISRGFPPDTKLLGYAPHFDLRAVRGHLFEPSGISSDSLVAAGGFERDGEDDLVVALKLRLREPSSMKPSWARGFRVKFSGEGGTTIYSPWYDSAAAACPEEDLNFMGKNRECDAVLRLDAIPLDSVATISASGDVQ